MAQRLWTREEEIIVFALYCKIPFSQSSKNHPEVIRVAKLIGRTPSAVNMKIGNLGSLDPSLKAQGIRGLTNASKLDAQIWKEFGNRWAELSFESERLTAELQGEIFSAERERINQDFFRSAVFAAYRGICCMTGLNNAELLTACRINSDTDIANPTNGLCLNALHAQAFDAGFITVTPDYKIHVSNYIYDIRGGAACKRFFDMDGQKIILPEKFPPAKEFLLYHNDIIFRQRP